MNGTTATNALAGLLNARSTLINTMRDVGHLPSPGRLSRAADALLEGGQIVGKYDTVRGPNMISGGATLKFIAGQVSTSGRTVDAELAERLREPLSQSMIGIDSLLMTAQRSNSITDSTAQLVAKEQARLWETIG